MTMEEFTEAMVRATKFLPPIEEAIPLIQANPSLTRVQKWKLIREIGRIKRRNKV